MQAQAEFKRQETLLRQNVSAQNTFDMAKAKRDSAAANVQNQEANLTIAKINLGYTKVMAPFDGVTTRHLISVGELVGARVATKLATIVQLDPIYVTFNVSEQEVLNIRANLERSARCRSRRSDKVPLDIGLMTEEGFPHKGHLNYVSPEIDPTTGTVLVRGLFNNPNRDLLPGFFVRVRVPLGLGAQDDAARARPGHLRGPGRQISAGGQQGRYRRAAPRQDRPAAARQTAGDHKGLNADDRVVISDQRPRRSRAARSSPSRRPSSRPGHNSDGRYQAMISKFFIERPVLANVLAIVIVLIGGVAPGQPADRAISQHRAADRVGDDELSRRIGATRRQQRRAADRAAGQRRRGHDLHAVDQHRQPAPTR